MKKDSEPKSLMEKYYGPALSGEQFLAIPTKIYRLLTRKLGLSATERIVILEILTYKKSEDHPYPSMASLAEGTGLSVSTVERAIARVGWDGIDPKKEGKVCRVIHRSVNGKRSSNAYDFTLLIDALRPFLKNGAAEDETNSEETPIEEVAPPSDTNPETKDETQTPVPKPVVPSRFDVFEEEDAALRMALTEFSKTATEKAKEQ